MTRDALLAYWFAPLRNVFVAELDGVVVGTYFIQPNQMGPGSHVANCGYATAGSAAGKGIARTMCAHSLDYARSKGFRAMQFNVVVSTNAPAVHLWQKMGFSILAAVPGEFQHPIHGYVDTYVMFQTLYPKEAPASFGPFAYGTMLPAAR